MRHATPNIQQNTENLLAVERETGIEPVPLAWKAKVLPLNYSRLVPLSYQNRAPPRLMVRISLVEEAGFEPA